MSDDVEMDNLVILIFFFGEIGKCEWTTNENYHS